MILPSARSLKALRAAGYLAYVVERWNQYARVRQDFGGFADILAFGMDKGVLAVQATTGANVAARVSKLTRDEKVAPVVRRWLEAGNRLQVHGWAKQGARGKRKTWTLRVVEIPLDTPEAP